MLSSWRVLVSAAALLLVLGACARSPERSVLSASAGNNLTVEVGATVVLDGSDSKGDITEYSWTLDERPSGSSAELSGSRTATATFTADRPGQYRATLTVSNTRDSASDTVLVTAFPTAGMLLPGDEAAAAVTVTFDMAVPLYLDHAHVEVDPESEMELLRTEIVIDFHEDVTVGEVNRLLDSLDGLIVVMTRHVTSVVVEIADPGSAAALEELLAGIREQETVLDARQTYLVPGPPAVMSDEDLGTLATPPHSGGQRLAHHYAVRAHGAWNAAAAIIAEDQRPWLVMADYFGDGAPADGFAVDVREADYGTDDPDFHGYHVLGIIAAAFGGTASTPGRTDATGIYPERLRVRAVDLQETWTLARIDNKLVHLMNEIVDADADARIIVNTSLGFEHRIAPAAVANALAVSYVNKIRKNNLEERVVHLTSAGNSRCTGTVNQAGQCIDGRWRRWQAVNNSVFTYAALGTMLRGPVPIAPAEFILVVENRATLAAAGLWRPVPTCASFTSILGGTISAMGTGVWSMSVQGAARSASGTSMASPQVAGLAALVWSLDPELSSSDVIAILQDTARDDYPTSSPGNSLLGQCNPEGQAQPVIDALGAVLAAGGEDVLLAMADFDDSGAFDEADIQAFQAAGGSTPALDYSRFDLNGDGITDSSPVSAHLDRFDLNGDRVYETITLSHAGREFTFDETALNDHEVLCALAYSDAYTGSVSERNRLLGLACNSGYIDVAIVDPPDGARFYEGDLITVTVEVTIQGQFEGHLTLSAGGIERDSLVHGYTNVDTRTLTVRHVCKADPFIEVAFVDSATGLQAVDRVFLNMRDGIPRVSITGPAPRYVRVYLPSPGADAVTADMELNGNGSHPDCQDPSSERIDQGILKWLDHDSELELGVGPTLALVGDYLLLNPVTGTFQSREIRLQARIGGGIRRDTVELRPCTSRIGLTAGQVAAEGYPECPFGAVMGSVLDALMDTFGTVDAADIDRLILSHLHGLDVNQALLDRLGFDPCDPTICDPHPPGFPLDRQDLVDGFFGDRGFEFAGYMEQLFNLLESGAPELFTDQLEELSITVAASPTLSDPDRSLFAVTVGAVLATAQYFAPAETGGMDGWQRFGFAGDPETLHERVDQLAPAVSALEGLLSAVVLTGENETFDGDLFTDAAVYAASIEALVQARLSADMP